MRVDEQINSMIEVGLSPAESGAPEHFALPFEMQDCTCAYYDAL